MSRGRPDGMVWRNFAAIIQDTATVNLLPKSFVEIMTGDEVQQRA